jgi:hypothetical protein
LGSVQRARELVEVIRSKGYLLVCLSGLGERNLKFCLSHV